MNPTDCRFCNIVDGVYANADIDDPVCRNDSYISIASIGALIEGWTLILPSQHGYCMADEYATDDFIEIADRVSTALHKRYGRLISFEHGARTACSSTSCGTAHAHTHIVPFQEELIDELQGLLPIWTPCRASEVASVVGSNEYLFYSDFGGNVGWNDPQGFVHVLRQPTSQFFRKILANHAGAPGTYDYRIFPHVSQTINTRMSLCELLS